ncbi:stage 0 sporulation family protein [Acidobacteriota bacterium]
MSEEKPEVCENGPCRRNFKDKIGIRIKTQGQVRSFCCRNESLRVGCRCIVETERGKTIATVSLRSVEGTEKNRDRRLKEILRAADEGDIEIFGKIREREIEAYRFCLERIRAKDLPMKLTSVEYSYDGSKAVFFFTADGRVDFRELVKDLAQRFHTRIEMRQIGVRDEAKMLGGFGPCGYHLCCASFLREFAPVSIKMAKKQNLSLNPAKISGICGRLMCCLTFEHENE